jgi:hypothetical protein
MEIPAGTFQLTIIDEPDYHVGSTANPRRYDQLYNFDQEYRPSTQYGLVCLDAQQKRRSCLLLASAGATSVHEHSAVVVREQCFVAVGDQLCCLSLPDTRLQWATNVDSATCFGVYYSAPHDCLISHGEMEIARVDFDGRIVWSAGGADIFTGEFRLDEKHAYVTDFNDMPYRIEIETGKQTSKF